MAKFLFILITGIVVGLFFYNDPQKLPWVENSFNEKAGYSVYSQSECRDLDCSIVREFETFEECREQVLGTYDIRKTNPTINLHADRAYCYSDCYRKANGELRELEIGICDVQEEVILGGF